MLGGMAAAVDVRCRSRNERHSVRDHMGNKDALLSRAGCTHMQLKGDSEITDFGFQAAREISLYICLDRLFV